MQLKRLFAHSYLHPRYLAARELHKIMALEAPRLSGLILDVGCGQKPYQHYVSSAVNYVGVDVPTTMHGLESVDAAATALHLPFQEAMFDACLCSEVLEHIPDPTVALSEMLRVTKVGGALLITVPFSEQLHETPYDFYRFTEFSLRHLLTATGWSIERIYHRGGAWLELGYRLSSLLYSGIGSTQDQFGYHHPKAILGPIVVLVCLMVQWLASLLDTLWPLRLSTIGYGVVAFKKI